MFSAADHLHMSQALRLAEKGFYGTSPNPRVGCVIVRDGRVLGSGWHARAGEPHAEINALQAAGAEVHGATAYVTLEPCSHHGRTPPCAEALIRAGVARVVAAMTDPNPEVAGSGCAALRRAGLAVQTGLMQAEAAALNAGFVSRHVRGRPWVRMKVAASLDGVTALANGRSQWITSEAARRDGHRQRARACVILTGIGTVLADDPRFDVRHVETSRQPLRAVVDARLDMPAGAKMLRGGGEWIFTATADEARLAPLRAAGARPVVLPDGRGKVDLAAMMRTLADYEVNEVLVEAGSGLNGGLIQAGLVDEVVIYLAPCLIGNAAHGMARLPELTDLAGRRALQIRDLRQVGPDIRIVARMDEP